MGCRETSVVRPVCLLSAHGYVTWLVCMHVSAAVPLGPALMLLCALLLGLGAGHASTRAVLCAWWSSFCAMWCCCVCPATPASLAGQGKRGQQQEAATWSACCCGHASCHQGSSPSQLPPPTPPPPPSLDWLLHHSRAYIRHTEHTSGKACTVEEVDVEIGTRRHTALGKHAGADRFSMAACSWAGWEAVRALLIYGARFMLCAVGVQQQYGLSSCAQLG
jgi:hypothetical protein